MPGRTPRHTEGGCPFLRPLTSVLSPQAPAKLCPAQALHRRRYRSVLVVQCRWTHASLRMYSLILGTPRHDTSVCNIPLPSFPLQQVLCCWLPAEATGKGLGQGERAWAAGTRARRVMCGSHSASPLPATLRNLLHTYIPLLVRRWRHRLQSGYPCQVSTWPQGL